MNTVCMWPCTLYCIITSTITRTINYCSSLLPSNKPPRTSVPPIPALPFHLSPLQNLLRPLNPPRIVKVLGHAAIDLLHHVLLLPFHPGLPLRFGRRTLDGVAFFIFALDGILEHVRGPDAEQDEGQAGLDEEMTARRRLGGCCCGG